MTRLFFGGVLVIALACGNDPDRLGTCHLNRLAQFGQMTEAACRAKCESSAICEEWTWTVNLSGGITAPI